MVVGADSGPKGRNGGVLLVVCFCVHRVLCLSKLHTCRKMKRGDDTAYPYSGMRDPTTRSLVQLRVRFSDFVFSLPPRVNEATCFEPLEGAALELFKT